MPFVDDPAADGRRGHRFPGMVLASLDQGPKIDPSKIQIEVPQQAPGRNPDDRDQMRRAAAASPLALTPPQATGTSAPDQLRQAGSLPPVRIEIVGVEPSLEGRLQRRPFAVEDREPAGVAVARLVDGRLAEHALIGEAQALRRGARRRVQRVAFPLVAAIAELVEDPAHHQVHRLGRGRGALQGAASS